MILMCYTFEIEVLPNLSSAILVKVLGKDEQECSEKVSEYLAALEDFQVGKCLDAHIIRQN
jgi:hypothetical protein